MNGQHSPLPWVVGPTQDTVDTVDGTELAEIRDSDRAFDMTNGIDADADLPYQANAHFIVQAVNSYYTHEVKICDLILALEGIRDYSDDPIVKRSAETAIQKARKA